MLIGGGTDTLVGATIAGVSDAALPPACRAAGATMLENAICCFMFNGRYVTSMDSAVTLTTR
jgi:hypothetical protein